MIVVTPEFIENVLGTGPLAEALERARLGNAKPRNKANWKKFSTWNLVCEEILDTEQSEWWLDDIVAELGRRGFVDEQIQSLRRFAWKTAGWLNYELMLWDWCNLDEHDIQRALEMQLQRGAISQPEYDAGMVLVEHPERCAG